MGRPARDPPFAAITTTHAKGQTTSMSDNIVIVAAARTAVGSFGGSPFLPPGHRARGHRVKALLERTGIGRTRSTR
jgi:hypothetical protein